jgi:hypothetical protein
MRSLHQLYLEKRAKRWQKPSRAEKLPR